MMETNPDQLESCRCLC